MDGVFLHKFTDLREFHREVSRWCGESPKEMISNPAKHKSRGRSWYTVSRLKSFDNFLGNESHGMLQLDVSLSALIDILFETIYRVEKHLSLRSILPPLTLE